MASANELKAWRTLAREWRARADDMAADGFIDGEAISACRYYERKIDAALGG